MLKEIQKELNTQDNRATSNPIFIVYDIEKVPSDRDYTNDWKYIDRDDGVEIGDTKEDLLEFLKDNELNTPDPNKLKEMDSDELMDWLVDNGYGFDKVYFIEKPVFKGIFFTEKAANSFIAQNKHNLSSRVHTYVESLYRNPEMQYIRNCLVNGLFIEVKNNKEDVIKNVKELILRFKISPEELGVGK